MGQTHRYEQFLPTIEMCHTTLTVTAIHLNILITFILKKKTIPRGLKEKRKSIHKTFVRQQSTDLLSGVCWSCDLLVTYNNRATDSILPYIEFRSILVHAHGMQYKNVLSSYISYTYTNGTFYTATHSSLPSRPWVHQAERWGQRYSL